VSNHPPYGYRLTRSGYLLPDEHEQHILGVARALLATGLGYREIIAELARQGLLNRAGNPFDLPSIHTALNRTAEWHREWSRRVRRRVRRVRLGRAR
jgi:hypothetical protein